MKKIIGKYWFFVGIAVVIFLAIRFPVLGVKIKEWDLLKVAIFVAFLITGLTLDSRKILVEIRNVKTLILSLISCFIFFPAIAVTLARLVFPENMDFVVGVCILSVVPVTIASGTVMSGIAGGNIPLSLFICVVSNLLAIFTIPFSLAMLLKFDQEIDLSVLAMIKKLIIIVLAPTVIGQILRIKVKDVVAAHRKKLSIFSQLVVLLIILNGFAGSAEGLEGAGKAIAAIMIFSAVLHVMILLVNYGLARMFRLDLASRATFTIHTSQKTLTISSVVWSDYFGMYALGLTPVIFYHLSQMIIDTIIAHRFREKIDSKKKLG